MTKNIKTKKGNRIIIEDDDEDENFGPVDANLELCAQNNFWEVVETKKRTYTPKQLWLKALDYFKWVRLNPLYEMKVFGIGSSKAVPHMRAMTESAFCLFSGVSNEMFFKWKKGERGADKGKEPMYQKVCLAIAQIIYNQKLEGAAGNFLNANIISRELGLADRTISDTFNYNSVPLTVEEIKEISKSLDELL